jgi:O-acetyl-ADP-ribose deacetylase (regulator of RNase III)
MTNKIEVVIGDITEQHVDAIVNAAKESLLGGGGVDGAIHRAAGPGLLEECRRVGGCPTGEARITGGYNLPAKWVIHTVGPVWQGGSHDEDNLLGRCYRYSLSLAKKVGARTVAFPSISTGAYGFPVERAADIAIKEIAAFLGGNNEIEQVTMVCFSEETYDAYKRALEAWADGDGAED